MWDLRYPDAGAQPEKTLLFGASLRGPMAPPRTLHRITGGGRTNPEPGARGSDRSTRVDDRTDLKQQFDFLIRVRDRVTAVHETANPILAIQPQLREVVDALPTGAGDMATEARAIDRGAGVDTRVARSDEDSERQRRAELSDWTRQPNRDRGHGCLRCRCSADRSGPDGVRRALGGYRHRALQADDGAGIAVNEAKQAAHRRRSAAGRDGGPPAVAPTE